MWIELDFCYANQVSWISSNALLFEEIWNSLYQQNAQLHGSRSLATSINMDRGLWIYLFPTAGSSVLITLLKWHKFAEKFNTKCLKQKYVISVVIAVRISELKICVLPSISLRVVMNGSSHHDSLILDWSLFSNKLNLISSFELWHKNKNVSIIIVMYSKNTWCVLPVVI